MFPVTSTPAPTSRFPATLTVPSGAIPNLLVFSVPELLVPNCNAVLPPLESAFIEATPLVALYVKSKEFEELVPVPVRIKSLAVMS